MLNRSEKRQQADPWSRPPFASGDDPTDRRLRTDVANILRAAIDAVEPARLVENALRSAPVPAGNVRVIAVGKAAARMAAGALAAFGDRIVGGIVVVPRDAVVSSIDPLDVLVGGHPEPDGDSLAAGEAVLRIARDAGADDVILALVSGGGSAIVALPPSGVSLADVASVTRALLRAGAPIDELNAVRKHLDMLKGGRLAREAAPAYTVALLLSDVPGDRPDVIASGPFAPDPTTFDDAIAILRQHGLWDGAPASLRRYLERGARGEEPESPGPGADCFASVRSSVLAGNADAVGAAARAARSLGYHVIVETDPVTGESREVGASFGERALALAGSSSRPACLLAGGETTVCVRGGGRGGRNQELALAAAVRLAGTRGVLVASLGTDGIDGPTDSAGALADGSSVFRAQSQGLDAIDCLERNDAWTFFHEIGDLIITGPTGTNVMDVQVALIAARE